MDMNYFGGAMYRVVKSPTPTEMYKVCNYNVKSHHEKGHFDSRAAKKNLYQAKWYTQTWPPNIFPKWDLPSIIGEGFVGQRDMLRAHIWVFVDEPPDSNEDW